MTNIDKACITEQKQREQAIAAALAAPPPLSGPELCIKCGDDNDRRRSGFAVCSCCMGGAGV
jgi:hypothetical protein